MRTYYKVCDKELIKSKSLLGHWMMISTISTSGNWGGGLYVCVYE